MFALIPQRPRIRRVLAHLDRLRRDPSVIYLLRPWRPGPISTRISARSSLETATNATDPDDEARKAGIRLDHRQTAIKETESGSVPIVPGSRTKAN